MNINLKNIIKNINYSEISGNTDISISGLSFDSRNTKPGHLFFAVKGAKSDGHQFINQAFDNGAVAVICEIKPNQTYKDKVIIIVDNSAETLGIAASVFYGNPSSKLKLVGVTGTNGKTTVATLLYKLFLKFGYKTGLLSTVANYINEQKISATHTTPDSLSFNKLLFDMVNEGCEYCFVEVSSHAIHQKRIAGLNFAGGIFTNITHDHLDYHNTFAEYIKAKKIFFDTLSSEAFALYNDDDKNGKMMVQNTKAKKFSYSLKTMSDYKAKVLETLIDGSLLEINKNEFWTLLPGIFNAYNVLSVYAVAHILGFENEIILTNLSSLKSVDGRFDTISGKGITAIVDYAHTPDALENVLNTIINIKDKNENIITVVGAGGDRDKTKRPEMAKIAAKMSNKIILTSDNPRTENPEDILDDMMEGLSDEEKSKTLRITDRKEAIRTATMLAKEKDIILIAGKGHENYQETNGIRIHFDDKEIITELLKS
jgi:UDP-N-acetylmuramoyl-L-alanyl-D-glutamate--2,6-diaminopimelate ligase